MNKKKIMLVFGTRPEAIKMSPLIHKLQLEPERFEFKVCVTSQHREMLDQVLKIFKIVPDFDLNLMKQNQNLSEITSLILKKVSSLLNIYKPDTVLVHGDTTTTLATSIAAFYETIPVGHVEAGLRTHNLNAPFPEEFNRQIVSKIARWHFAPTVISKNNLLSEGIDKSTISVTGNTVIDSLKWVLNNIDNNKEKKIYLEKKIDNYLNFNWKSKNFILVTAHRRENFGSGLMQICHSIKELASKYKQMNFVYPVHLNPNVFKPAHDILGDNKNIHLLEPLEYEDFIYLLKYSYLVLTDSGGIQEEAPSLGKPVLVMRDITERPEAIEAGTVKLIGSNQKSIVRGVTNLIDDYKLYKSMSISINPYGDGLASNRILDVLRNN